MATNQEVETAVLQRQAARLVEREVYCCMSSLVATLVGGVHDASGATNMGRPLSDLCEQAAELASPVLDYEGAAREAGWKVTRLEDGAGETETEYFTWRGEDAKKPDAETGTTPSETEAWQMACKNDGLDPHENEVFEHWAVSSWLADKLEAKGERVDRDFAGLIVWARTTTGQAISIDHVIETIVRETGYAAHAA